MSADAPWQHDRRAHRFQLWAIARRRCADSELTSVETADVSPEVELTKDRAAFGCKGPIADSQRLRVSLLLEVMTFVRECRPDRRKGRAYERPGSDGPQIGCGDNRERRCRRARSREGAWTLEHYGDGDRSHHRRRHLRPHWNCSSALCGAGHHALLCLRRHRLRVRRAMLCRARGAFAGVRQHLQLYLRDAWRACGLDHRLGPGCSNMPWVPRPWRSAGRAIS